MVLMEELTSLKDICGDLKTIEKKDEVDRKKDCHDGDGRLCDQ
ncbi:hypothetical protein [Thalassobacillus devorans]|nr:hypothetical protein [Thalassobacillus devorans]